MRPSSLLVLIAAAGTALARSNFGGKVEEPEPTPCTVKAWVRAEDMKPNAVSHGELKVKVVQPCTDQVESVTIRLRLDEMSELSIMANTTSDVDLWDFSGEMPSQVQSILWEWTTTKHKRSAFRVEKTLSADGSLRSENWAEGVVFPFTVVSPNVNYPPAIFPPMFNGFNTELQRSSVGRLYRYIASVKLVTESGQSRTAEAPAGFSAFRPIEHAHKPTEDLPFQTSLTAVETNTWRKIRCEDSEANSTWADTSPATLGLTVTLPEGNTLVQGNDFVVNVKLNGPARVAANQYSFSAFLGQNMAIHGALAQVVAGDDGRHPAWFHEIHGSVSRDVADHFDYWSENGVDLSRPLRCRVRMTYPRTTSGRPGESPFEIHSTLAIILDETLDVAQIDAVPIIPYGVYRSAARSEGNKTSKPVEKGWEFGECDSLPYHKRRYRTEIPITVVGSPSGSAEPPLDYLVDHGHVPVPRIMSGHVSTSPQYDFDLAEPVTARDTSKSAALPASNSGRDRYPDFGSWESIDAKAGHYVGALWHRKVHGVEKVKGHDLGAGDGIGENQAVLSHPVHEL